MIEQNKFIRVEDIANDLEVSKQTIYRWINAGTIPSMTIGKLRRVNRERYYQWKRDNEIDD